MHLEQIVAICRAGSFSGAARALGIAQPTLSRSIARLERDLGLSLFQRHDNGARPTPLADFVATRGTEVLRLADQLEADLRERANGQAGLLRIGVGPASRLKPLPEIVRLLEIHFPGLRLDVRQEAGWAIARGLHEGRYDVIFTYAQNAKPYGDLIRVRLFEDRIVAAAHPAHPLVGRVALRNRELFANPVASFRATSAMEHVVAQVAPEHRRNLDAFVSDDAELIRTRSIGGDYVAYVPRFVVERELEAGTLVELDLARTEMFPCWMLATPQSWTVPMIQRLADLAKKHFASERR